MPVRGDGYITILDTFAVQSCEVRPRTKRGECGTWGLYFDDGGLLGATPTQAAVFMVEVVAVLAHGTATAVRVLVPSDYAQPRTRLVATGVAPGARSYKLIGRARLLNAAGGFSKTLGRFFLNGTPDAGAPQFRGLGVVDF